MSKKLYPAVIQHVVKGALVESGFMSTVNSNRLNALVENNVEKLVADLGITTFKPNSSFQVICDHLAPAFSQEPNQGVTVVDRLIKSNHSMFASQAAEDVTKAFGQTFSVAKKELDQCFSEVDLLLQQYHSEFKKMAQELPIPDYKQTPVNMESWELNNTLGPEHLLVKSVNKTTGFETGEANMSAFRTLAKRVYIERTGEANKLSDIAFSQDQKAAIITKIAKWSGLTEERVGFIFSSVCTKNGLNYFYNEVIAIQNGATSQAFETTKSTVRLIVDFLKGLNKVIEDKTDEQTYIDNETLNANVRFLTEIQKLGVYALTYYRHQVWDNLLVLPNGLVNSDLQAEATAQGITKEDLRLTIYSNKFNTGYSSLTVGVVNQNKDKWKKEFERKLENAKFCADSNVKQSQRLAFNKAATLYLSEKKRVSLRNMSDALGGELATHGKTPEYCFYTLVAKANDVSKLTGEVLTDFSSGFAALEGQCSSIDKRAIEEVQGIVLIRKMVTFIKDAFC